MKIAIIYGHPNVDSLCYALADKYAEGAKKSGAEIRKIQLAKMDFYPSLKFGYKKRMTEEADLVWAKESILWADHLVFVYPVWWGTKPAILTGFIERVFTPGFAFNYVEGSPFSKKLLGGKTARVIVTSDAPRWYIALAWRGMTKIQVKKTLLNFCGVKPVRYTHFGSVRLQKTGVFKKWLAKTHQLGIKLN